jgi:L-asparaginase II
VVVHLSGDGGADRRHPHGLAVTNPVLVEVTRGPKVESIHRGSACVVDARGHVVEAWGDIESPTCPRSAIKPFQSLPLIESGAADAFAVTEEELALACASHSGEPVHVERVSAWLARLGLSSAALECGAHPPSNQRAADTLTCAHEHPSAVHNNCSGKHTGFLTLALHLGVPTRGYVMPDHPVQRAVLAAVGDMMDVGQQPTVRDGCSAPNIFAPLRALALGFARVGTGHGLSPARTKAANRIVAAMHAHPVLMSGHGRPCARLIAAMPDGIVKTGAEGVFAAALPAQGFGLAVKIDDGAGRAAVVAITALLERYKAFRAEAAADEVLALKEPAHFAWAGSPTGVTRPAPTWLTGSAAKVP